MEKLEGADGQRRKHCGIGHKNGHCRPQKALAEAKALVQVLLNGMSGTRGDNAASQVSKDLSVVPQLRRHQAVQAPGQWIAVAAGIKKFVR